MSAWVARIACLVALLVGGLSDSRAAGDIAPFNAAVESISAHNRVAIGYLRTENIDFAALEIDRMRNAWVMFTERFAGKLHADLKFARIEEILEAGLHDTLTEFLERIFELGNRISRDFLVPLAA